MAITSKFLRDIEAEARPIIERQMNDAKIIAGLRDVVAAAGGDWGALKALIKARVEDDNDESGEGKRVRKVREKADCIVAYDDMLGSNMNEKNFSASQSYAEAKGRGPAAPNTSNFKASDSKSAGTPAALTDTQEQPEEPATQSDADSRVRDASGVQGKTEPQTSAPAESVSEEISAPHSPSPETPQATADDEATPPAASSAPIPNPQPTSSPAIADSPASISSPEPGYLSEADVPAFLKPGQRKTVADYRPECKHPDNCGSSNPTGYCYQCRRAMEAASETEAV